MNVLNTLLSILFPPSPGYINDFGGISQKSSGDFEPVEGDGILWRAYDVRQTGIERTLGV